MNQYAKSLPCKIEEEKMKLIFSGDKNLKTKCVNAHFNAQKLSFSLFSRSKSSREDVFFK
jgi:prolyl-tRNA editing enzyme YbaK/EbsC (Cys-tRNA(Pro) deacylase)